MRLLFIHLMILSSFGIEYMPLVTPNKQHTKLEFNTDTCQKLVATQHPWKAVSIIGPYHSGKSFLLNALINQSDIFPVLDSNNPTTKGIDIYLSEKDHTMYIDTEGLSSGLASTNEKYDAMIFSIAALSSHLMLYNTIRTIDQQQLDYLEMLARRTQLFALKSELKQEGELVNNFIKFPTLFWVVRDYSLDEDTTNWFKELLNAEQRKSFGIAAKEPQNDLKIDTLFDKMKSFGIFLPNGNKNDLKKLQLNSLKLNKEFVNDLGILKTNIESQLFSKSIQPKQFCDLVKFYVDAANDNEFPNVPSIWDGYLNSLQESAKQSVIEFVNNNIQTELNKEIPLCQSEMEYRIELIRKDSNAIAEKILFGVKALTNKVLNEIQFSMSDNLNDFILKNDDKVTHYLKKLCEDVENEITMSLDQINLPITIGVLVGATF